MRRRKRFEKGKTEIREKVIMEKEKERVCKGELRRKKGGKKGKGRENDAGRIEIVKMERGSRKKGKS